MEEGDGGREQRQVFTGLKQSRRRKTGFELAVTFVLPFSS